MHTCMCICLCAFVCTGLVCVCVCVCVCVLCVCAHTHGCVLCFVHACVHGCWCVCTPCMCAHVHVCVCVCVCMCLCERRAGSRRGPAGLGRGFKAAFPTAGVSAPDKQPGAERCRRLAGCVSELLAGSQKAVPGPASRSISPRRRAGEAGGREGKSICFSP